MQENIDGQSQPVDADVSAAVGPMEPSKSICDLPDAFLENVFSYIPLNQRLRLSEVCPRFKDVSCKEWLDIIDLDLAGIPSINIGAVLRLSPKVQSIYAARRMLILVDLASLYLNDLTSLKLYDVKFALASARGSEKFKINYKQANCVFCSATNQDQEGLVCTCNVVPPNTPTDTENAVKLRELFTQFLANFPQLNELVLVSPSATDLQVTPIANIFPVRFPPTLGYSLTRLQVNGQGHPWLIDALDFSLGLAQLSKLECLSLTVHLAVADSAEQTLNEQSQAFCGAIASLTQLRELSLDVCFFPINGFGWEGDLRPLWGIEAAVCGLRRLEVLFLVESVFATEGIVRLITTQPALRILVLSGRIFGSWHPGPAEPLPARKRYPNGFGGDSLPTLHVFADEICAHYYGLLTIGPSDASIVYPPFKWPLLELLELETEEVVKIFEDVWLAEAIKEASEWIAQYWQYPAEEYQGKMQQVIAEPSPPVDADVSSAKGPTKSICDLSDVCLENVFSYIPPKERLHLSEVSCRFKDVSRKEWLDVIDLDLTPIPSANIGAILRLSPKVESVLAARRVLILDDLTGHYLNDLTSIKLYDVRFALASVQGDEKFTEIGKQATCRACFGAGLGPAEWLPPESIAEFECSGAPTGCVCRMVPPATTKDDENATKFQGVFAEFLGKFSQLSELVLFRPTATDLEQTPISNIFPLSFAPITRHSLTRLVLFAKYDECLLDATSFSRALTELTNLECLGLGIHFTAASLEEVEVNELSQTFCDALVSLAPLRELSLDVSLFPVDPAIDRLGYVRGIETAVRGLRGLEVLFLTQAQFATTGIAELIVSQPALRILLLAGVIFDPWAFVEPLPARKRFPNGFDAAPLPTLHIFADQFCAGHFGFTKSPSGASEVHPIDKPLPEFLEKEEVAAIFDDVWLAEAIKEGVQCGAEWWNDYEVVADAVWYNDENS